MERIPEHKDLMDDADQASAYASADFSVPHEEFVRQFKLRFPSFMGAEVLDLGCGTADVIIRFAREFPAAKITGIDGSRAMLDIGRREVLEKGLQGRIDLMQCRIPSDEVSGKRYDAVISNSLLHHLEDPRHLWQTVKQCAGRGAPVFIMDLMRPDTLESAQGLVELYAAEAPSLLQRDFFQSLLAAYRVDEVRTQVDSEHLAFLNIDVISDRHLLVWGTM